MKGFTKLAVVNLKLLLREPVGTFFTMAFPSLMVVLFGAIYGNQPVPALRGHGWMDLCMPGYTAMVLSTVGLMGIPITISGYRESGALRRLRATPLKPLTYIAADVTSFMVMALGGMGVLMATGRALHGVHFYGHVPTVISAVAFSALAIFGVGYLVAAFSPGARAAQVIGMTVFYPMLFLSGAAIPLEVLPESINSLSAYMPLTYAVQLLRGLWFGGAWADHLPETAVLAGVFVVTAGLAARFFRWE